MQAIEVGNVALVMILECSRNANTTKNYCNCMENKMDQFLHFFLQRKRFVTHDGCFVFFFFSGGSGESKGKISVRKNKQANLYHLAVMKIQNVVQLPSPPMIIKPNSIRKGWSCCKKTDTRFTLLLETCINI